MTHPHIQQFESEVRAAFPRLRIAFTEAHVTGFLRCSLEVDATTFIDVVKLTDGTYKVDRCKGGTVKEARDRALDSYHGSAVRLQRICTAMGPTPATEVTP